MKHSENLQDIAKALSSLQSEIKDAEKDSQGYGYKYADLGQVLSIIRPLASKHGLAFTQHASNIGENIVVETMIMHNSGQWMSSELCMPLVQGKGMNAAQAMGSVITYGRRYALTAIFGITQQDEDAHIDEPSKKPHGSKPQSNHGKSQGYSSQTTPTTNSGSRMLLISIDQEMQIGDLIRESGADRKAFFEHYGISNLSQLKQDQYEKALRQLTKKITDNLADDKSKYLGV